MNAHVLSHFFYCPLLWLFCSKCDYKEVIKVHKRALRTIYFTFNYNLKELLLIDRNCSIHQRHLQTLMVEIFKSVHNQNAIIISELFKEKSVIYNFRYNCLLKLPKVSTVKYGTNSLIFKGSLIWNTLPIEIKRSHSIAIFKKEIKKYNFTNCTCLICK